MKKTILSLLFSSSILFAHAQIVKVNAAAAGNNDGTSWTDAYTDLQTAIANTSSGSIWVVAGTYYPGASGNNAATFTLKNGVQILGGFNGTEGGPTQRDPYLNETILSGDLDQSGTLNANDAYHVVSTANTSSSAVLDGFTITGGNADGTGADGYGGGILSRPLNPVGTCSPVILRCNIMGNYSAMGGGGVAVMCQSVSATAAAQLTNCKIHNNNTLNWGGGAYCNGLGSGAGSSPVFENCLFYFNDAPGGGDHLYAEANISGAVNPAVIGNTFGTDESGDDIVFFLNGNTGSFTMHNSVYFGLDVFSDGLITGDNNCGNMTYVSGSGNFNLNPMYINAGANDYRPSCASPCINAGINANAVATNDINGDPRVAASTIDLGAYETNYPPFSFVPNASPGSAVCFGGSVTLTGSVAGPAYIWTGGVTEGVSFIPSVTNTYTVTGTDGNGCVHTETITVTVNSLPNIIANPSVTDVCLGGSVFLYGTGGTTYAWSHGVTDAVPFNPITTQNYTVTGTDANGCQNTSQVIVNVEDNTSVTAGPDRDVCRTGTPSVNIAGNGGGGSINWMTLGSGSWNNNTIDAPDYFFSGADVAGASVTLVIQATFAACPVTRDTMVIILQDMPSASAGSDIYLCNTAGAGGVPLNGSFTNSGSFQWTSNGTGSFSPNNTTANATYIPSAGDLLGGSYTLQFKAFANNPACPDAIDGLFLTVLSAPVITPTGDYTVCEGDSIYLHALFTSGNSPFTYTWKTGPPVAVIATDNSSYYHPGQTDTYDVTITDINGCSAVDTFTVSFDASNAIYGNIYLGAGQLNAGTVYLMQYLSQSMTFDTVGTYNLSGSGAYMFSTVMYGNYLLKVVPDDVMYPNAIPTYFGDVFQWDSATVISHNCTVDFNADINAMQLLPGSGTGSVSGYIYEGDGYNMRFGQPGHNHILVPGGPLKGIDVKLGKNPGGGIQARTMTDTTGHYAFDNLPDDSYRIYVDIPGLPMDSFYILTVSSDTAINLNYYADSNSVFPILPTAVGLPSHQYVAANMDVYPNPAKNYTSLRFEAADQSTATIRLLDITGKTILTTQLRNLPKGKHEYQLNFAELKSGIYFIEVQSGEGVLVKKLVVE